MNRILVATAMSLLLMSSPQFAAAGQRATSTIPANATVATSSIQNPDATPGLGLAPAVAAPRRPVLLPGLYVGSALLQGYDTYSTLTGLKRGAGEGNMMMRGVVKSPAAFVAVKAGITAAGILAAERLWKDNHRVGAVMMMVVSNGVMGLVAAHNASALNRVQ